MNFINNILYILVFIIIVWFQSMDDAKYNIKNKSYYNKYKLPIIICLLIKVIDEYKYCMLNVQVTKNLYEFDIIPSQIY